MKRIGVLTSGGDSPGMNAAIRGVTRQGLSLGLEVIGVRRGYDGLVDADYEPLTSRSVGSIMRHGGTVLLTSRCPRWKEPEVREATVARLRREGMDALVVIGGNGSYRGALELCRLGFPVMGVPGSIDNDMGGTDMAIGTDTCLNTILDAVDKIKDTAGSLHRPFIVEVMGRECGYLALAAGLAGGAELVVIPEKPMTMRDIESAAEDAHERGKPLFIAIVAEGARPRATEIVDHFEENPVGGFANPRLTILGHVQRGGSPTAFDRILATRLGVAAVNALVAGETAAAVGLVGGEVRVTPLADAVANPAHPDVRLQEMAMVLAR